MENSFFEKIDDFIAGKLPADEAQKMATAAADDPALAAEIDWRRTEHEIAEAAIARQIRGQFASLQAADPTTTAAPKLWKAALPATLLLAALVFYFFEKSETNPSSPTSPAAPKTETETAPIPSEPIEKQALPPDPRLPPKTSEPVAQNFEKIATQNYEQPNFSSLRTAGGSSSDPIAAAIELTENQRFREAIERLEAVSAADPQVSRARYMLGHLNFLGKNYAASEALFRGLAASKIQPWAEESEWFALLAGLAAEQKTGASFFKNLEKLVADAGHPYHEHAVALAADLRWKIGD